MTYLEFQRRRKRLTQAQVAVMARIATQTRVSDFELRRQTPTEAEARRLAQALELTPDQLLNEPIVVGSVESGR